jgi:SNF2 family DNA or RNA helicase
MFSRNYHQVLVLLLRLRQICSHPSLIQEDGITFVYPNEADVNPEFATELTRARRLVSPEFVDKLKEKFKVSALMRLQAEKEVHFLDGSQQT